MLKIAENLWLEKTSIYSTFFKKSNYVKLKLARWQREQ